MTSDEIVIVERMHKRPFGSGKRALLQGPPGDIERHQNEPRAERLHALDLRSGRRLDGDDRARHARSSRRVRDALARIARADGPHPACTLGCGQQSHGIGGTP